MRFTLWPLRAGGAITMRAIISSVYKLIRLQLILTGIRRPSLECYSGLLREHACREASICFRPFEGSARDHQRALTLCLSDEKSLILRQNAPICRKASPAPEGLSADAAAREFSLKSAALHCRASFHFAAPPLIIASSAAAATFFTVS